MKKPTLISRIFATFGYAKVPKEAVTLSLLQESYLETILSHVTSTGGKEYFKKMLEIQQVLTRLLQSGRMLGK